MGRDAGADVLTESWLKTEMPGDTLAGSKAVGDEGGAGQTPGAPRPTGMDPQLPRGRGGGAGP